MAKLYKHKSRGFQVRYVVYLPSGESLTKYRYTQTLKEGQMLLVRCEYLEAGSRSGNLQTREIARARHDGLLNDREAILLSGGNQVAIYDLSRVLSNYEASSKLANTAYGHIVNMRRANRLKPWLEQHPIPTLSAADIKGYLLERKLGAIVYRNAKTGSTKVGCSDKTARNELGILQQIIREALALGMVDVNVALEVDVPVKRSRVRRSLSMDEISVLVDLADKNRHLCHGYAYELVMVALYTGLRRGELRTLEWSDIDLDRQQLIVQSKVLCGGEKFDPKSGKAGIVTIPDVLVPILSGMDQTGRFVFGGDQPIVANRFYKTFKDLLLRAGLDSSLSLHHARHTFGSWLLRLTGDLKYVQGEMRHLDIDTTKNYAHTIPHDSPARRLKYE